MACSRVLPYKRSRSRWINIHCDMSCMVQACYGHTEGAAGTTGLLLAIQSTSQRSAAGITCLRDMNLYVSAAVADWEKRTGPAPMLPRLLGPLCGTMLAGVILCTSCMDLKGLSRARNRVHCSSSQPRQNACPSYTGAHSADLVDGNRSTLNWR